MKSSVIKQITIDSESKGSIIGGEEFVNDNCDVWVEFENGDKYVALFLTYENINWLRNKNKNTGECLNGTYFWASEMLIIEKLDRTTIEQVIDELIEEEEFCSVFKKLESEKSAWIFNGISSQFSGGIFETLYAAEEWIMNNNLTGMLTKYPINKGVFDWAEEKDMIHMKPEKLVEKRKDPKFIGGFTTASMEHYQYENGKKE